MLSETKRATLTKADGTLGRISLASKNRTSRLLRNSKEVEVLGPLNIQERGFRRERGEHSIYLYHYIVLACFIGGTALLF